LIRAAVILSILIAAILGFSGIFENEAMYGRIHADAQGYYGYLVAVVLEQSFDWEQVIHSYSDVYFNGEGADFTATGEFGRINKYYAGTALMLLPFFLLSCLAALTFGYPVDGYSAPFQAGVMIGALFYAGVGMYFLIRFLKDRGINQGSAILVAALCLFATPLFHYSISEPAMSHAYSFGLVGAFLYTTNKWLKTYSRKLLILSALSFGLIVLIRPVNGLVIMSVPFLSGGVVALFERLKAEKGLMTSLVMATIAVIGVLLVQVAAYWFQVGQPIVWSYQGEGFNFLEPELWNFLFSYKKGLFVYTPFAFIGLIGIVFYILKNPAKGAWLMVFIALTIYVLSSWWNWYYGGSLGMRAMVEYMPFFAFGLAYLFDRSNRVIQGMLGLLCTGFIALNLIQSYQYQKFILHWDGMNKERYWQVFLKTDRKYDGIFYRVADAKPAPEPPA
jgi:hypothetical protein